MKTDSIYGTGEFDFGPANLYWDTESGGVNQFLGFFDALKLRWEVIKIPLVSAQTGSEPADQAVSGHKAELEAGLAQATVERLENTVQGFVVERASAAGPVKRIYMSSVIGQRDSSIRKQMTVIKFVDGKESVNPLDTNHILLAAPSANAEFIYDAATQRFVAHIFKAYQHPTIVDVNGNPVYYRTLLVP